MTRRIQLETPTAPPTIVMFLLDRTGSMMGIKDDTLGALNAYIEAMKAGPSNVFFTLMQFDSISLDKTYDNVPMASVEPLTPDQFQPRGWTNLFDAVGEAIERVDALVRDVGEAQVVICIQTDGAENMSKKVTQESLNAMIKEKTEAGWQFNFMGAGLDAYANASRLGLAKSATIAYQGASRSANRAVFGDLADRTMMYASGAAPTLGEFSDATRTAAGEAAVLSPEQAASVMQRVNEDAMQRARRRSVRRDREVS